MKELMNLKEITVEQLKEAWIPEDKIDKIKKLLDDTWSIDKLVERLSEKDKYISSQKWLVDWISKKLLTENNLNDWVIEFMLTIQKEDPKTLSDVLEANFGWKEFKDVVKDFYRSKWNESDIDKMIEILSKVNVNESETKQVISSVKEERIKKSISGFDDLWEKDKEELIKLISEEVWTSNLNDKQLQRIVKSIKTEYDEETWKEKKENKKEWDENRWNQEWDEKNEWWEDQQKQETQDWRKVVTQKEYEELVWRWINQMYLKKMFIVDKEKENQ